MGSFSEIVLNWSFREDTPDYVLAAFSALYLPEAGRQQPDGAPALPAPHQVDEEDLDTWRPDQLYWDASTDPEPWRHDWAGWLRTSMSPSITPSAVMVWERRWTVSCRWAMKCDPSSILPTLNWLLPYLEGGDGLILLGYIHWDVAPRPVLVWATQGRVEGENLNVGDEWEWWEDWPPPQLR